MKIDEIIAHFEKELPRKENYPKYSLVYLKEKQKKLAHLKGEYQRLLDRGGDFANDRVAQGIVKMLEEHRQVVLRTIAEKKGRTRARVVRKRKAA